MIRNKILLVFLVTWCSNCDSLTPFLKRGQNAINSGVMVNIANQPNTIGPIITATHSIRPPNYLLSNINNNDNYQYQSPSSNLQHYQHHHSTYQSLNDQTQTRQSRNPFDVFYEWRQLDYEYPTFLARQRAILNGDFVPTNNLPLGLDRWRNRIFLTTPRWKNGVPASLSTVPLPALERSPPFRPYPSWDWHANPEALNPDCTRLMSVYRIWIDECDRLWVLDSGIVNATIQINQVCPPKLLVFDLRTDQPIFSYELPPDQVKQDSLHSNLIVDIRNGRCQDAYAYLTDVWRFGITVFSLAKGRSWRTTHHFYFPNPEASDYTLNGVNFQWTDGVFGISISPPTAIQDRTLFFHPMSSFSVGVLFVFKLFFLNCAILHWP